MIKSNEKNITDIQISHIASAVATFDAVTKYYPEGTYEGSASNDYGNTVKITNERFRFSESVTTAGDIG